MSTLVTQVDLQICYCDEKMIILTPPGMNWPPTWVPAGGTILGRTPVAGQAILRLSLITAVYVVG